MDENLVVFATSHSCLTTNSKNYSIYNILMIKTYVASFELQYLFNNQLVFNCSLVFCIIY
jgi:hypothetical protein